MSLYYFDLLKIGFVLHEPPSSPRTQRLGLFFQMKPLMNTISLIFDTDLRRFSQVLAY